MATTNVPEARDVNVDQLRNEWISRLSKLVDGVRDWAKELGWATRNIEKPMHDSQIGTYQAPALVLQKETTRVLLEPIARSAPGAEGIVDLYLMPAYDDIASLYFYNNRWNLHYWAEGTAAVATVREAPAKALSKRALREVLDEMTKNVA